MGNESAAKAKFDQAVSDYIKSEAGEQEVITGWVLAATVKNPQLPNSDGYIVENSSGMPYHSQIGLITATLDEKRNTVLSQVMKEA
jgi:hypothetical protein